MFTLIEYIKNAFDISVEKKVNEIIENMKKEEEEDNENAASKYETLLRKEEKNIRQHISVKINFKRYLD